MKLNKMLINTIQLLHANSQTGGHAEDNWCLCKIHLKLQVISLMAGIRKIFFMEVHQQG